MRVTSVDQWLVSWSASIACGAPDCPTALKGEEQPYKKDIVPICSSVHRGLMRQPTKDVPLCEDDTWNPKDTPSPRTVDS